MTATVAVAQDVLAMARLLEEPAKLPHQVFKSEPGNGILNASNYA